MSARIYIYLAQVIVWTLFQFFFSFSRFFFFFFQELASQYPQTTRGCRKASVATHTPSISFFFPSRTSHTNSSTTNAAGAAADAAAGRVLAGLSSRVDKKDYTAVAGSNH